ncbi:MAG: uridine diphosphate-N-acetylglucosamine-binding protein YvcK [Clostridia bacterium]
MRFLEWLRPGLGLKRWVLIGLVGVVSTGFALVYLWSDVWWSFEQYMFAAFLLVCGVVLVILSIKNIMNAVFKLAANSKNTGFSMEINAERLSSLLYEKRILIKGPKIVAIGGGTGLSTLLRGLKQYSSNITAIVTVTDDGGGSGVLREDLGILPPGDIRNCILSLADTEPIMQQLMQHRFKDGRLKGQNFGNLFLAALDGISENFQDAVNKMCEVLAVTGRVLAVTTDKIGVIATLEDGTEISGETQICHRANREGNKIKSIKLSNDNVTPNPEAIQDILAADVVIMGPGSLYTSIIPNLLVNEMAETLKKSKAMRFYICNIMTQPGESTGYNALSHIKALEEHSFKGIVQYCAVNTGTIPEDLEKLYEEEGQKVIKYEKSLIEKKGIRLLEGEFVTIVDGKIRHNHDLVSKVIMEVASRKIASKDKKKLVDYFYVNQLSIADEEKPK